MEVSKNGKRGRNQSQKERESLFLPERKNNRISVGAVESTKCVVKKGGGPSSKKNDSRDLRAGKEG